MANYMATTRTNYFAVKDEARLREIIESCVAEDAVHLFEDELPDGNKRFGFGCYGNICGFENDDEVDSLYESLQKIVADSDAILIVEIGYEKLRYLVGCCVVITAKEVRSADIWKEGAKLAADILGIDHFETKDSF